MKVNEKYEKWKKIEGTKSTEVSNFGRVRDVDGFMYSVHDNGNGYYAVPIVRYGVKKKESIHRLVAEAFVPNPQNKSFVNHKNGDPSINCEWNLEWCTPFENQMHRRFVLGKDVSGSDNPMY